MALNEKDFAIFDNRSNRARENYLFFANQLMYFGKVIHRFFLDFNFRFTQNSGVEARLRVFRFR